MRVRWVPGGAPVELHAMRQVRAEDVDVERLRVDLTVTNPAFWQQTMHGHSVTAEPTIELFQELGNDTILVPRHYRLPLLGERPPTVYDFRTIRDRGVRIRHSIKLRDSVQEAASKALRRDSSDKIISLACGKGKTVVSLHAAAEGNRFPLLVVVNTNALLDQWTANHNESGDLIGGIAKFYGLKRSEIGHIQAGTERWQGYKVAVAMLHSLCRKKYSREFYRYWRLVIFDEVHRLGAGYFHPACSLFPCERWGLSATVDREDRMDKVFRLHLGKVVYKDLEQPLKPVNLFVATNLNVDMRRFVLRNGRVNMGGLYTHVSEHEGRNKLIMHYIRRAVASGRTILVLGERRSQLFEMCEAAKVEGIDASVHVGQGMDQGERSEALRHRVVFATQHLAKEGLDRSAFDTLFILIPFGGKGRLQQTVGRILRIHEGKKDPKVYVFVDNVSIFGALASKMRRQLTLMGFKSFDLKGGASADSVPGA